MVNEQGETLWVARKRRVRPSNPMAASVRPISSGVNGHRPLFLSSLLVNRELTTLPCQRCFLYLASASFSALPPPKSQAECATISCSVENLEHEQKRTSHSMESLGTMGSIIELTCSDFLYFFLFFLLGVGEEPRP